MPPAIERPAPHVEPLAFGSVAIVSEAPSALRSTLIVAGSRLLNTALALALGMLSATYFGTSVEKDCYLVAQTLPGLVTTLLLGGLYGNLLVSLAEVGRRDGMPGQQRFARRTLWHLTLVAVPCVLLTLATARPIARSIAPGFPPGQIELSAALLRISVFGVVGGIYFTIIRCLFEVRGRFAASNLTHLLINVVSLLTLGLMVHRLGIYALAAGPLAGVVIAVGFLSLLATRARRAPPSTVTGTGDPEAEVADRRRFWTAFLPMSLAANTGSLNLMVDNAFASFLPAGSITNLGFAFVIVSNAELLTTFSLAEVAFSRLAAAAQRGGHELAATLRSSQRYMLIVTAPLCAGALAFGRPLVRLLFERGAFPPDSTSMVARLLACYAPEILLMGPLVLLSRALFAMRRLRLLAWTSAGAMVANAILDALLMGPFGLPGIALATTAVALVQLLALVPIVRREIGPLRGSDDTLFAAKVLACAATMGVVVFTWSLLFERWADVQREAFRLVEVAVGLVLAAVAYLGLLHALRIREARVVVEWMLKAVPLRDNGPKNSDAG
jgi:putative peptidoglycan lipid II flippase